MSVRSELLLRRVLVQMRALVAAAETVACDAFDEDDLVVLYDAAERAREALTDADLELCAPGPIRRRDLAGLLVECDRVLEQERTR